jgi:hypothetical protein
MEFCGAGSVADVIDIVEHELTEPQIKYVLAETLKVCFHECRTIFDFCAFVSDLGRLSSRASDTSMLTEKCTETLREVIFC